MQPDRLVPHPEGGRFQEVFRSAATVIRGDGAQRAALTHIYFALEPGERSRFHRVAGDEVWNLYRGVGLRLFLWDGSDVAPSTVLLTARTQTFCHVVPAGMWQAAEPIDDAVLVGCSVGPGFDYADFELIDPSGEDARRLRAVASDLAHLVDQR